MGDVGKAAGVPRKLLLGLALFGSLGLLVELLLIEHHDDRYQWIPLILLGFGSLNLIAVLISKSAAAVRALRWVMALQAAGGFLGVALHFKGNREFELEMVPGMKGTELIAETLQGATPVLAPGAMLQIGLLGLLCCWGHPALRKP